LIVVVVERLSLATEQAIRSVDVVEPRVRQSEEHRAKVCAPQVVFANQKVVPSGYPIVRIS